MKSMAWDCIAGILAGERRYFLNSIPANADMFASAGREHRGSKTACTGGGM
ncbi:MAG: hypothetical protein ACRESZ_18575 [Methylococcales bacterium]